jgi:phosphonate transport system substrate-binding protein
VSQTIRNPITALSLSLLAAVAMGFLAMPLEAVAGPGRSLRVGFTPWENPQDMARMAAPMVELLGKATGVRVDPFLASDYAGVIQALQAGQVDIAFLPPAAFVLAEKRAGAKVILKSLFKGRSQYFSAIFTRSDGPIRTLSDLRGKRMAFVDPTSTSGSLFPKLLLKQAGIDPERGLGRVMYAGSHDAVVMAVLRGKVDAGAAYANDEKGVRAAWTQLLKTPEERRQIRVVAISRPIPADTIAVRPDLDPRVVSQVKKALIELSATPEGRERIHDIYRVDGFTTATSGEYEPVREVFREVGIKIN